MRDEWFIRGNVPMTKSEVRAVSLSKLELTQESVLADIGAGTGSVSVEAALFWGVKSVWAIEKNPEAIELLKQNAARAEAAGSGKIHLLEGEALSLLTDLQLREQFQTEYRLTHAFLGGTSGNMKQILKALLSLNPQMRIVINVIALESVAAAMDALKELSIEAEIVSIQTARAKKAGSYHLMQGQNPVYIISFGGKEEELL